MTSKNTGITGYKSKFAMKRKLTSSNWAEEETCTIDKLHLHGNKFLVRFYVVHSTGIVSLREGNLKLAYICADETGFIRLIAWGSSCKDLETLIEVGRCYECTGISIRETTPKTLQYTLVKNELELHFVSGRSQVKEIERSIIKPNWKKTKLHDVYKLGKGEVINVIGYVVSMTEPHTIESSSSTATKSEVELADSDDNLITICFWNTAAPEVRSLINSQGETILSLKGISTSTVRGPQFCDSYPDTIVEIDGSSAEGLALHRWLSQQSNQDNKDEEA